MSDVEISPAPSRPPLNSLATKLILFVFLSTFVTALGVSWVAIQTTHGHLSASLERRWPAALERAAERVVPVLASAKPDRLPAGLVSEILAKERPDPGGTVMLVDASGRVLATGNGEAPSSARVPLTALTEGERPGVREYTNAAGVHAVGRAMRLANSDFWLVIEKPFELAYAPVLSVVTQVFVMDLFIVLLFSFLAYRITTAVVRPVETLSDAARRIAQGQLDHEIPEPRTQDEIGLLARTFNDMMRRLRGYQIEIELANERLMERNVELQQAKETFEQLSITDGLTKLHNHRFFQDHLTREIKRVSRIGEPLAMLLADIDDFKALNDRLGHAAGDELLVGMARIMTDTVRDSDLVARYGGEEFVILTTNTDQEGAYQLAEKIRMNIAETSFILDDSLRPTRITVSIGVAQYSGNRKTFFQAADRALYRAKAQGKNCVVMDQSDATL